MSLVFGQWPDVFKYANGLFFHLFTAVLLNINLVTLLCAILPQAWKLAVEFATKKKGSIESDHDSTVKVLLSNLETLDASAFDSDDSLYWELLNTPANDPIGIVLIPQQSDCTMCGNKLAIRKDRPSHVVVYSHSLGIVPGSHYHKVCTNRTCGYTQYYGYYTTGKDSTDVYSDSDWESLPYFSSSRDTFFSKDLMKQFNAQILLGQISFKQCAEIYNELHKCGIAPGHDSGLVYSNSLLCHSSIYYFCYAAESW